MKEQSPNTIKSSSLFTTSDEVTTVDIAREINIKRNKMRLKILYWTLPLIVIGIAWGLYYTLNMGKSSAASEESGDLAQSETASDVSEFVPPLVINVTSMGGLEMMSYPMKNVLQQGPKKKPSEIVIIEHAAKDNEPSKFEIEIDGEIFTDQGDYKALAAFINKAYTKKFPHPFVPLDIKLDDDFEKNLAEEKEKSRLREESIKTDTILDPASPDSPGWSMKHEISLPDIE